MDEGSDERQDEQADEEQVDDLGARSPKSGSRTTDLDPARGGVRLSKDEHDALLARMGIDPDERRRARVTRPRRPGDPMWW